eukprot:scaffold237152_cov30-Tisochrysis_lutea.AAC.4
MTALKRPKQSPSASNRVNGEHRQMRSMASSIVARARVAIASHLPSASHHKRSRVSVLLLPSW